MPDYGVDTTEWEPLPWTWAAERLSGGRNFWIVTVSADGRPHAMPVWGVWNDEELRFAFSCGPRSRKAANLAVNPQVVVASEDTVECLSVEGCAQLVDDDRLDVWIARYLTKYTPMSPDLSADFLRQNLIFEVVPDRALAVIEREEEFATRATRWRFAGD
jgi:hypothetical protein